MIARKIQNAKIIDFEEEGLTTQMSVSKLREVKDKIVEIDTLDDFDKYILKYFYEGICTNELA